MAKLKLPSRQAVRLVLIAVSLLAALAAINVLVDWLNSHSSEGIVLAIGAGVLLFWTLILLARSQWPQLRDMWVWIGDAAGNDETPKQRNRLVDLFIISFVVLFVETMLIRYIGSQTRIFAFYKNIPLIGEVAAAAAKCSCSYLRSPGSASSSLSSRSH